MKHTDGTDAQQKRGHVNGRAGGRMWVTWGVKVEQGVERALVDKL
jgi:hypothetical protein